MVAVRRAQAGFTLTELMVVVVILSLLAAVSTPLFTRDNAARKGRGWSNIIAQTLQRARFQAMGDRANIHVLLYRTRVDIYRAEVAPPPANATTYTLLSTIQGPVINDTKTVAIWEARTDLTVPGGQDDDFIASPSEPTGTAKKNEIVFTTLGSTVGNANWRIYIRNELLPSGHPDASFLVKVGGLTGYVTANDKVVLSP